MVQEYAEVQNQSQNRTEERKQNRSQNRREERNRIGVAGAGVSKSAEQWSRAATTTLGTYGGRNAEQQRRRNGRWPERSNGAGTDGGRNAEQQRQC